MEVTDAVVARISPGNLRVAREEFGAVWAAAERRNTEQTRRGVTDWYASGVAATCRWMAGASVQNLMGRRYPARPPVSDHEHLAYEELIEAEYLAAELLDLRCPQYLRSRPGWCEAIRATLRWAWRRNGPPPLPAPLPPPTPPPAQSGEA
jgi:hypothetical protein